MEFQSALNRAKDRAAVTFDLKPKQTEALQALYSRKDVMCLLPTGYGKSVIYQLTPFLLQPSPTAGITLVVSPLNAIMRDQVLKLSKSGILACYLDMSGEDGQTFRLSSECPEEEGEEEEDWASDEEEEGASWQKEADPVRMSVPMYELMSGKYNLVYAHPEALLTTPTGRRLLRSKVYQERVCCIAIDEGHMILEWGGDFREAFGRLQELLALFPDVPAILLTATASPEVQNDLIRKLGLRHPVLVSENPDRANIKFFKRERLPSRRMAEDLKNILGEMLSELRVLRENYPITIMYTDLDGIRVAYRFFEKNMGEEQYCGERDPENRLFAQYHADYTDDMKEFIVRELTKTNSRIRIVIATVALGMGLDAPAVRRVIHFKSPTSIGQYLQEAGRAGRDGLPASAFLHYNRTDVRKSRKGQQLSMREFCLSQDVCLREQLLAHLGFHPPADRRLCQCCQVCELKCRCETCVLRATEAQEERV